MNGREEVLLPEVFTADVAAMGVCKRLQAYATLAAHACYYFYKKEAQQSFMYIF